jgi:TonB family protein
MNATHLSQKIGGETYLFAGRSKVRKDLKHSLIALAFLLAISGPSLVGASQEEPKKFHALLPESWARKSVMTKVMPAYPHEAVQKGVSGMVHIKFETSPEGEVLRIKVKPRTNPLLVKAVADAVKQWKFKPQLGLDGVYEPVFSRLIFHFSLSTGRPHVELYNPGPNPSDVQQLSYYNSARERREWREWDEVPTDRSPKLRVRFTPPKR